VRSFFGNLGSSLRLPNVVGRGMPERIRSVGFAFLGLTAAAGLALVAIFAQMGFPLLSPVPLPDGPSEPSSVSRAVPVEEGSATAGLAQAQGAVAAPGASRGQGGGDSVAREDRGGGADGSATSVSDALGGDSPDGLEPVATSPPAATPDPAPAPVPTTTATTTTESTSPPAAAPAGSEGTEAQPGRSTAGSSDADRPKAKPAAKSPKSEKPARSRPVKSPKAKPARSDSKAVKPEAAPAAQPKYVPAPESTPVDQGKDEGKDNGNGNGNGEDPENR
jgi:hypothetical protein